MCSLFKKPKIVTPTSPPAQEANKPPVLLRNTYFDTVSPLTLHRTKGRGSLRIDRTGAGLQTTGAGSNPLTLTR